MPQLGPPTLCPLTSLSFGCHSRRESASRIRAHEHPLAPANPPPLLQTLHPNQSAASFTTNHRHLDRSALSERSESNRRAVERPAVQNAASACGPSLLLVIPVGNLLFASEPMSIRSQPPTRHPSIPNPSSRPKRSKLHNHRHLDRSALSERSESNGRAVERPAVQDAASACGSFLLLVIPAGNLLLASEPPKHT